MQEINEESLNESVKSEQSPRVVLWEIDLTVQGGERYFFCNELNEKGEPVTWQGRQYQAYPIEGSGFEMNGKGQQCPPVADGVESVRAGHRDGGGFAEPGGGHGGSSPGVCAFSGCGEFRGGQSGGGPGAGADVTAGWWSRCQQLTAMTASFVLATPTETDGALFPGRIMLANTCMWDLPL